MAEHSETDASLDPEPQGAEFIDDLIDTIADGNRPRPGLVASVGRFLNNHQAKIDLTQVGLVKYHMSRVQKLSKLIERLEDALMPEGGENVLETAEAVELLKMFSKDLHLSTDFITNRASRPVTSSPDGMRAGIEDDAPATKNSMLVLSPERRNRIRQLTAALQSVLLAKRSA